MHKVLIIDDDELYRASILSALTAGGMRVRTIADGRSARSVVSAFQPDVVLVDWMLRTEQNGRDVARDLKRMDQNLKVILITGLLNADASQSEKEEAFDAVVTKPLRTERLCEMIESLTAE